MHSAQLRIDDMKGFIAISEAFHDKRDQHAIFVLVAKETANVAAAMQRRAGQLDGAVRCLCLRHGPSEGSKDLQSDLAAGPKLPKEGFPSSVREQTRALATRRRLRHGSADVVDCTARLERLK